MSKNRVEELESKVAELEATVQGLTEELVESKERIRTLEGAVDVDENVTVQRDDRRRAPRREAEPDDVAAAAAEADDAEGDKSAASDEADNEGEESGLDDIIVA